ncbi:hypothetical protein BGW36DRAFT_398467 [Talaromyces proteolyticus]|uniref:Uncharacterized protein n=1 Tax=Talaromyces proteolyticus TaxID=1131652 RepID=A0AAD4KSS3_9EURO|nr:uncharacterized protein BGW36DRAFT_398467 [Talaromyces proteolyticus]KAH8695165.1 hypothetical protein BGW36DRAFT_398467 [Talaromyces proteolyticus]
MEEDSPEGATTTRSTRVMTLSTRAREALADTEYSTKTSKKTNGTTKVRRAADIIQDGQQSKDGNEELLLRMGRFLEKTHHELKAVKDVLGKQETPMKEVLKNQLYLVKIDNTNRTAVIDMDENILLGVTQVLRKENRVDIAKIYWLSKKDVNKAYGSMVVYTTKEATRNGY